MRAVILFGVFVRLATPADTQTTLVEPQNVAAVDTDDLRGRVWLRMRDGRVVEAPRQDDHIRQMDPAISDDHKWVGWLVRLDGALEIAPRAIVLLHNSQLLTLKVERMIWRWSFLKSGDDGVVLALGPRHPGEPAEYVWYELPSLRLRAAIRRFEINEYDPDWARTVRLTSTLD
jgi:hypothetical protein